MEHVEIDWENIVSHYELDEVYEHINAPKWLDFSAPDATIDDVAWFCRTDCRHPISYEDFDRWNPSPKVKLLRSGSDAILAGEQNKNRRDVNLKKRSGIVSVCSSPRLNSREVGEDNENQNPNMEATPVKLKAKKKKEAIKSSAENKAAVVEEETRETQSRRSPHQPRLKNILSARNLFPGKDILSQISEFCHELKKLATGKDSAGVLKEEKKEKTKKMMEEGRVEEKKALISTIKTSSLNKKRELALKLDGSEEKRNRILKEARAHPPTPQRFPSPSGRHLHPHLKSSKTSANSNSSSSPLCKLSESKDPERSVLRELHQGSEEEKIELIPKKEENNRASVDSEVEGSPVDLFWFLRPCAYLS
ncbi:uncharacterized protein LOC110018544 [Phalaenopsis equestris]|uniref:uncharacterized protein LOC110018544 n=1 Tax=Phalaenopsis equestris TaxID=78828 RepID=UPI0009E64754|nr:uncharacterized protein LOC110018544 [Phalaenopsis equestris]